MKIFRTFMLWIVVAAYANQALAVGFVNCQMMQAPAATPDAAGMASMDHSAHHGASQSTQEKAVIAGNCCDGGLCAGSHCHFAPALLPSIPFARSPVTPVYPGSTEVSQPFHRLDALYRPPISR